MSKQGVSWIEGSPSERGVYWVCIGSHVTIVEIGPSLVNRSNPNAALLIKTLDGVAYDHMKGRSVIRCYAPVEMPRAPERQP